MVIFLFFIGFVLLILGAQWLVDSSSGLAKRLGVSELVIGLTIVSFGTSLPELIVNIFASIDGNAEIAIGNILGSNIANVLLILGVSSIIGKIQVQKSTLLSEIPFSIIAILLLGYLANASLFEVRDSLFLSQLDGVVLLFFFLLYMLYIVSISKNELIIEVSSDKNVVKVEQRFVYVKLILGLVGLYFGGIWVVDGAIVFAKYFGMSESFIGLTVIAIGTSLPELVTSATAAYKGKGDIAIGNVIGSNIFNILWILGLSSIIKPLPFLTASNHDILVVTGSSVLLIILIIVGNGNVLKRWSGFLLLLSYIAYIWFLINRG